MGQNGGDKMRMARTGALALLALLALGAPAYTQPPQRPLPAVLDDLDKLVAELRSISKPPSPTTVIDVPAGGSLQAAIDKTTCGETIRLTAGARYVGTFKLPARSCVVTITSAPAAPLAIPDRRITPVDAPLLATIAAGGLALAIDGTAGATNWKLDGLRFESRPDGGSEIIAFQDAKNITLSRLLIVAGVNGQRRAIRGNGQNVTLTRSHIANIWFTGQDSQAFCAWDGAGPYTITDNYLEAASENVMFGGADNASVDRIPSDILIEGNTFTKQLAWKGIVGKYVVKNLLEFKDARRVMIRRNTFKNSWTDAQNGYAILFKTVNQDGRSPWNVLEDVTFEDNEVSDVENGINILGNDYEKPSGRTTRITMQRNLLRVSGVAFQIGGEAGVITIDHNTIQNGYTLMTLYPGGVWPTGTAGVREGLFAVESLTFTNNLANHNDYGIKGESAGVGLPSLTRWAKAFTFARNVLLGGAGKGSYPPETWFDLASVPAGVLVGR